MAAFSPRAALCTVIVVGGLTAALTAHLPGGLFGLVGWQRDGLLALERGGAPPSVDEKSEIVGAVLAHAAQGRRAPVCVRLSDEGEALASERAEIAQLQRTLAEAGPAARARRVTELEQRRSPVRTWSRVAAPNATESAALSEENIRTLGLAEAAVLATPTSGQVDLMLDMASLPETLRGRPPGCDALMFTAPAVAGNIAFVETAHVCGGPAPGLCGSGQIYALSRSSGRWQMEASAPTWIS